MLKILTFFLISTAIGKEIGSCKLNNDILVIDNSEGLKFELYDERGVIKDLDPRFPKIQYKTEFIHPWSEVNIAYYKYREGRMGTGMFSWDRESGEGLLRFYAKPDYFYTDLSKCVVDESQINLP